MHDLLPVPDDDERFYRVKAKGKGMKPHYWNGYVLASSQDEAEAIVRDGHRDINYGIQGIRWVKVVGEVGEDSIEDMIRGGGANAVIFRDGDGVERVHRGMLRDD